MPEIKHAENIAPALNIKKATVLASVMRNGRVGDAELAELLKLKSATAASYYRKDLEKQGIVEGYTAVVNWKKVGYPTEFIALVEGESAEANVDIEKEFVASLEDYARKKGEVLVLPSGNGRVIISDILACFGERPMTAIIGHATSDQDAIVYSRYYVAEKFTNAKTTFLLVKGRSIQNFFIQGDYIDFMKGSFKEDKTIQLPEEFKKRFPSLAGAKGKRK